MSYYSPKIYYNRKKIVTTQKISSIITKRRKMKPHGELAERSKAPSWKGGVVKATKSSNLLLSATRNQKRQCLFFLL